MIGYCSLAIGNSPWTLTALRDLHKICLFTLHDSIECEKYQFSCEVICNLKSIFTILKQKIAQLCIKIHNTCINEQMMPSRVHLPSILLPILNNCRHEQDSNPSLPIEKKIVIIVISLICCSLCYMLEWCGGQGFAYGQPYQ